MKPMLACSTLPDLEAISYPKYASTKLDGIRCLIKDGVALSRSLKPIPNKHIQKVLSRIDLDGCDGELMVNGDFNSVQSAVMSASGVPDFTYWVFDYYASEEAFEKRLDKAITKVVRSGRDNIKVLPQLLVNSPEEVEKLYREAISSGQEGLILKDINGKYKHGRSTMKQETMLKLKEVVDCEGTIIGTTELMHNHNDAYTDNVGNQVRDSHQEMMEAGDTLGALVVKSAGAVFNIGTGFTAAQRAKLWSMRESLNGALVKFKHLGLSKYGVPRCPVFLTLRDKRDL